MNRHNALLVLLVSIFVFHSLVLSGFMLYHTHKITGRAAGQVEFCINTMPVLNTSNCSSTLTEDVLYTCLMNWSDDDGDELTLVYNFSNQTLFTISDVGLVSFTPRNADVGNHTVNISINDYKCKIPGTWGNRYLEVVNVNDPPYLSSAIPDQLVLPDIQLRAFYLDDHFNDPDGDDISYTSTIPLNFDVVITSGSEVFITATECPSEEYVQFTAMDPYNATASSNLVKLNCSLIQSIAPSTGGTAGGGGSGGGGGGSPLTDCIPKLVCLSWEKCQEDERQRMKCFDEHGCKNGMWYLYRACNYIAQCNNGVQDWNEEGIDCGGPCPPCPTCDDGILNGDEKNTDCGGSCPACVLSKVLFGEWVPTGEYDGETMSRQWNLSIMDVQGKYIDVLDTEIDDVPNSVFASNATDIVYIKNGDIWATDLSRGISRRLTWEGAALSLTYSNRGIVYSRKKFIEDSLFPRLYMLNMYTLESRSLFESTYLPMYYPTAVLGLGMTAFSTMGFEVDFNKRGFKKTYPNYIFGKVVLPEKSTVHVMDYWGEEIFRIEDKGQNVYAPRLSPDGNYLAYFSYDDKQADLWVVSLDGTYKKRLTDTPQYNEIFPVFSMEGKIVFTADYKGKYALYSTDINASNITLLLESPNPVIAFDWYYSPSCFDGTMNQDEVDIDCGGICGPCGTCFDGVKNQNEVGIDCGGVCPPCKVEERPLFFEQARNTMLISLLIFALVLLAAAYIFRKQISKYIGRLVDWILHRKFRHEFIDPEFKKSLLRRIAELEDSFNDLDFNDLVLAYTLIAREYFAKMADLSPEFDYSELHKQFEVLKIKGLLKKLLDDYADALNDIEFGKKNLSDILFRKHIEELRYLIVFTSQKNLDDLKRKEYKIMLESADDKFQDDFRQMLIALQFEEVLLAKKKYNALLRRYNFFSNQHKAKYYEDISKAYNYMRYVRLLL